MTRGGRWWAALATGMLVMAGCARPQAAPAPASRPPAAATPAARDEALSIPFSGPPAGEYRTDRSLSSSSPIARQVQRRFPDLRVDLCLQRAAEAHLRLPVGSADRIPLAFTEAALHWAGCPDPAATVTTVRSSDQGLSALLDELAPLVTGHPYTHIGFARADAPHPYRTRWVALLVDRRVDLRPLPTSADPGARLPLQFRLDPPFRSATVAVTLPGGQVREVTAGASDGWTVASLECADTVGRQWVELMGHGPAGPQVLALFPLAIGRPPPDRFVGAPRRDESWIRSREQAEDYAAELVHRDRQRFDLPLLQRDPALDAVARAHSQDMATGDYFAHISPTTGSVADRLRRRRYPASFAAENIAMAEGLAEAEDGLMRSPEHRAAILTRRATRFGVGIAVTGGDGLGRRYLLTQVFAEAIAPPEG